MRLLTNHAAGGKTYVASAPRIKPDAEALHHGYRFIRYRDKRVTFDGTKWRYKQTPGEDALFVHVAGDLWACATSGRPRDTLNHMLKELTPAKVAEYISRPAAVAANILHKETNHD